MSYDLKLKDPLTGETILLAEDHHITGGTYALGGTKEAWINITYNYGGIFRQVLGENGIRTIYGMTGAEALPLLEKAIYQLKSDMTDNYWDATEGNAKKALLNVAALSALAPQGIWSGD